MYYNTKNNQLLSNLNINGYLPDGSLVQGLNLADTSIVKACGILPVKFDGPPQPENSYEDINQRNIIIEEDGVVISRVWISNPVVVPESVSARQIRLWLIDNNISLTSVENAINNIVDETLREKTLVEWEYAPYIERNHPLLNTLGEVLGLNSEQINRAFLVADKL